MSYKPPLERHLEQALKSVGLPFVDREMIYDGLENLVKIQQLTSKELNEVGPIMRAALIKRQTSTRFFLGHLVYRETDPAPSGLVVTYSLWPSEENLDELNHLERYTDAAPLVETILQKRSFFRECITIYDHLSMPPLEIPYVPQLTEKLDLTQPRSTLSAKEMVDKTNEAFLLELGVSAESREPIDAEFELSSLFDGMTSNVKDVKEITRRIATFVGENYHTLKRRS